MMGWDWGDAADWGMGFGMIFWVLVLAVIIGLVVWALNRAQYRGAERSGESALEVLRRRFAAGDIDADEYERRLSVLHR